jgi:hypothetical protein
VDTARIDQSAFIIVADLRFINVVFIVKYIDALLPNRHQRAEIVLARSAVQQTTSFTAIC